MAFTTIRRSQVERPWRQACRLTYAVKVVAKNSVYYILYMRGTPFVAQLEVEFENESDFFFVAAGQNTCPQILIAERRVKII